MPGLSKKLRSYFIRDQHKGSRSDQKRLILTYNLTLLCMVVAVVYTVLDVTSGVYYSMPSYAALVVLPVISLLLMRHGYHKASKVTLIMSVNLVVFWTALNDPFETGVFLLFIPTGIGSFAVLGFSENRTGILLSIFTAVLFVVAYIAEIRLIDIPRPTEMYITISFILNYFISLTISVLIVYFQMNLNRASENDLIQKEIFASQKNAELRKVNEELDRFVYSVSHDLRSPLSSILGLINIARHTGDQKELNEILEMIEGRVHSQDHFIREIIDYSRNARTETTREVIDLRSLIEEVILSLKYHGEADRIDFQNTVPGELRIFSDRIRLRVIISNLVGNAIKYHDYTKPAPYIRMEADAASGTISISDNGIGMPPEHQEKIFNMFYRGSDRSSGSGLGLFITREAVAKLGGTIVVSSSPGAGSTFSVRIPFA